MHNVTNVNYKCVHFFRGGVLNEANSPAVEQGCKKTLIDKDMSVTDLFEDIEITREYVSRVVNRTIYAPEIAERISKHLVIKTKYGHNII